ncbi:uncharacterized protein LOC126738901 [Anthonomus grandis grandis]|uniref:uncharacterized protein LOC126738901 n=1 Tax=Anthonomus grandis grandis TaxID=2921223 RepID=UPI00216680D1|nr:uncharacterized protein LOC126738901 [Anthonomus grandis grandis]
MIFLIFSLLFIGLHAAPAERWPNVMGSTPKNHVVIITPTSEYDAPVYHYSSTPPTKDSIFHSNPSYAGIEQHYPPPAAHYPPPHHTHHEKNHYDVKLLRKHYDDWLNKKVAFKTGLIKKAVDKTVDVTAKLAQYTADFLSRVAIETAAKLAKTSANHVIDKKGWKYAPDHHYH